MSDESKRSWLPMLQAIFFIAVSIGTIGSLIVASAQLYLTRQQSKLVNIPVVGPTDVRIIKYLKDVKVDTYEGINFTMARFCVENVGNAPAKIIDVKFDAKIGNTTKEMTIYTDFKKGFIMLPKSPLWFNVKIDKNDMDKMINQKEKYFVIIEFYYSDWNGYQKYHHKWTYQLVIENKSPVNLVAYLIFSE